MNPYAIEKENYDGDDKFYVVEHNPYYWYSYPKNWLDVRAFYGIDLNSLKIQLGAGYERLYSPYHLTVETTEDGTKIYTLEDAISIWYLPEGSATSYGNDRLDTSFKLFGDMYIPGLNIWAKDLYFEKGKVNYGHFVTPNSTLEPLGQCDYDTGVNCKDQTDYMKIRGTAGIDLNFGGIIVSPYIYAYKYSSVQEIYYRHDTSDKSSNNSSRDFLVLKPGFEFYLPSIELKAAASYEIDNSNWLSWSYDYEGKLVTTGASEIAYYGWKSSYNETSFDISKKLSVFGLDTKLSGLVSYSMESQRGLAYDKDKKEINGKDVEYGFTYAYDYTEINFTASALFAKKFFDDKVAFGTVIEGGLMQSNYKRYEYDSTFEEVRVNQESRNNWYISPFSEIFAELKFFDGLWVKISGEIDKFSITNEPDKWLDDGKYVNEEPSAVIEKESEMEFNLSLSVRYEF